MNSRTERILIIDADEQARNDLSRYLEARGFYVTGYPDIQSARGLFEDELPDVIFADLPADAIRDLTTRLADSESFIPVVTCTASNSSTDVIQDRKSTRLNSSHVRISYAVFCLKKK